MAEEPELFRMRVRYKKQGRLKYLGHLEVLHTVERIVRRARLPYAITQGFSPHMKIAFGTALPVGTASDCEYFDLFLTARIDEAEALSALVAASPEDLAPSEVQYQETYGKAITTELPRADYRIDIVLAEGVSAKAVEGAVDRLRTVSELSYARGRKEKVLDLAHTLKSVCVEAAADGAGSSQIALHLVTHSDNEGSMRPDIYIQALDSLISGAALDSLSTDSKRFDSFEKASITRTRVSKE